MLAKPPSHHFRVSSHRLSDLSETEVYRTIGAIVRVLEKLSVAEEVVVRGRTVEVTVQPERTVVLRAGIWCLQMDLAKTTSDTAKEIVGFVRFACSVIGTVDTL